MRVTPPADWRGKTAFRHGFLRGIGFNLAGQGVPLLAGIFAIPILTERLGPERFGILALAWVVVGYLSLFDLGLGRALTRELASRGEQASMQDQARLVFSAAVGTLAIGIGLGAALAFASASVVGFVLTLGDELASDATTSLIWLAACVPVLTMTSTLRGFLEAKRRFDLINIVQIPLVASMFLVPVAVLPLSTSLSAVVAAVGVTRIAGVLAYAALVVSSLRGATLKAVRCDTLELTRMMRYGGWLAVSHIIGPILVYLDRFLIAALLGATAVGYYAAPYEVVTRLWIAPAAVTAVLFPMLSEQFALGNESVGKTYKRGLVVTLILIFPIALALFAFAPELLLVWLGREYSEQGAVAARWLVVAVFINCLAQISAAAVQAAGRPDLCAKFHLLEIPFFLVPAYYAIELYGLPGAAAAWTARVAFDFMLLASAAHRLVSGIRFVFAEAAFLIAVLIAFVPMLTIEALFVKAITWFVIVLGFGALSLWFISTVKNDRATGISA